MRDLNLRNPAAGSLRSRSRRSTALHPERSLLPLRVSTPLIAAAVSALLLVTPASARADGSATAEIRLDRSSAARDCPDARTLGRSVNALAHRIAIVEKGASVLLRVGIDRSDAGYTASLTATGARSGERDLDDAGATCEGLSEALAVSIALLLDEDAPEPEPARPADPPAWPSMPRPSPGPGHGPPLPSSILDVLAVESVGLVGPSTFGLQANADFRITRFFTVGGGFLAMIDDAERFGAGTLHLNLVAIRSNACFSFRVAHQSIGGALCGFPALGAMVATARGFDENHTASQPWFALGTGAVADGPIVGPLGFAARLDVFVPLVKPSFVVEDLGSAPAALTGKAYEASPVGIAVGIGIRALIP